MRPLVFRAVRPWLVTLVMLAAGAAAAHAAVTQQVGTPGTDDQPGDIAAALDQTPPQTTISSGPAARTASSSASLVFSSSESGSAFECKLDAGAFAACSSPRALIGLAVGFHSFSVRATDVAGNVDATPATRSWIVDQTAPQTTISSGPAARTASSSASLVFSSSESESTFECKLDAGAYAVCSSPKEFSALAVGSHAFSVRAVDVAGNVDVTAATRSWVIDRSAPQTTISSGPAARTALTSASLVFSSSESGSTFECKLDAGAYAVCSSPRALSGLAVGFHSFAVRAIDVAGNVDATPATRSWIVDRTAPQTTISSGPPARTASLSASLVFSSSESGSTFECKLDAGAYAACSSPRALSGLAVGFHSFAVRAIDVAGNVDGTPASRSWIVDQTAPKTTISSGPPARTASTSASLAFSSSEAGSTFECRLDAGAYSPARRRRR